MVFLRAVAGTRRIGCHVVASAGAGWAIVAAHNCTIGRRRSHDRSSNADTIRMRSWWVGSSRTSPIRRRKRYSRESAALVSSDLSDHRRPLSVCGPAARRRRPRSAQAFVDRGRVTRAEACRDIAHATCRASSTRLPDLAGGGQDVIGVLDWYCARGLRSSHTVVAARWLAVSEPRSMTGGHGRPRHRSAARPRPCQPCRAHPGGVRPRSSISFAHTI